jgi:putative transferase (TIGR04331 family)
MFLATTANQKYWKTDEKILFLGEWCKVYDQKYIWSNLDYETLPFHWDEWGKFDERYKYLENIYEILLNSLASNLNEIHNENYSLRYWRIILGPWLSSFINTIYDRYLSVKSAINSNKVSQTWIPPSKHEQWVPNDTLTFLHRAFANNNFNLYLYGQIIIKLGQIPFEYKEEESFFDLLDPEVFKPLSFVAKTKFNTKKTFKKCIAEISKRVPDRFNQIVFSSSGLSYLNQFKLQISLGQIPYVAPHIFASKILIKQSLRKGIDLPQGTNEFESILKNLIAKQLPTSFLEGYSAMRNKALDAYPKNPKVIFSSNDFAFGDGFKFWSATQIERGAKVIVAQHGGGYGMIGPIVSLSHELKICDKYFTWGWGEKEQPKTIPMASGKLKKDKYNVKSDPNGAVLWVTNVSPLFIVRLDHIVSGYNGLEYCLRQQRFLNVVCPEVFKLLLVRFHHAEFGWSGEKRLTDSHPSLKLYRGGDSMHEQLHRSRLCIHDYLGTTWLETLSMNFPTVVIWDPFRVKIMDSAQPYVDDLRRVQIFQDTPESAAAFLGKIYRDPISWWTSQEVQQVREKCYYQFARKSENMLEEWKEELLKTARLP